MKINRHGRAKILTQSEIQLVFAQGFDSERDKTLFGVCLFTAARIREAIAPLACEGGLCLYSRDFSRYVCIQRDFLGEAQHQVLDSRTFGHGCYRGLAQRNVNNSVLIFSFFCG
ncbi:hypothetical protein [Scytonema sp. PRP1]|uniref:hypothetical protein n=1 Tax=Scytonema sp. PRP1 TaxID=3120513 RepID=UPI002FD24896